MPNSILLGVDGGGTKTVAWLACRRADQPLEIIGRGVAAGCNPRAIGTDAACRELATAIENARADARLSGENVHAAVLAVAGAAQSDVADVLTNWASQVSLANQVRVVSDVMPLLTAGTPDGWGVALIAGTGSVAHAYAADGTNSLVGGWGYLLGDEGSGFALGRAALQATIRAAEGQASNTDLPASLFAELGIDGIDELKRAIYGAPDSRSTIASLAPLVTQAAARRDPVARQILDKAADDLADLVRLAAGEVLDTTATVPLALTGGVLTGSSELRDTLLARLQAHGIHVDPVTLVREPVSGCLQMAANLMPA